MALMKTSANRPEVSVIIPARNEEASLGTCLESLASQSGMEFEIIVVNDHSTDRTREIAESFPGVRVIEAGELPTGWTGKNNAVACGARRRRLMRRPGRGDGYLLDLPSPMACITAVFICST